MVYADGRKGSGTSYSIHGYIILLIRQIVLLLRFYVLLLRFWRSRSDRQLDLQIVARSAIRSLETTATPHTHVSNCVDFRPPSTAELSHSSFQLPPSHSLVSDSRLSSQLLGYTWEEPSIPSPLVCGLSSTPEPLTHLPSHPWLDRRLCPARLRFTTSHCL